MSARRSAVSILVAGLVALGSVAAIAPAAVASDGRTDTATTTYVLDPAHGVIKVTADIKVTNQTRNRVESYACTQYQYDPWLGYVPYATTCTRTITYYLTGTSVWVENEATAIKVTSSGGAVSVKKAAPGSGFRRLDVTFAKLWYGQTRKLHVTYSIPGSKPRSADPTRALKAYANFCVTSHGLDSGTVTVRVPAGYTVTLTGSKLTATTSGKVRVYASGAISDPLSWWACLEGENASGYAVKPISAQDGRTIMLQSWPEDAEWTSSVRDSLLADLPALVRLIGRPMTGSAALVVKETVTGNEYAGWYDRETNTISVGEDFHQPGLVAHELAHVWFNHSLFYDTWLSEGYAEWAGRQVEASQGACSRPTLPAGALPQLDSWRTLNPRSTAEERDALTFQYDASCFVVTSVAQVAGVKGMTLAMQALFDGRDPYAVEAPGTASGAPAASAAPGASGAPAAAAAPAASGAPAAADRKVATWKQWLDAVDEIALEPAKASRTLASDLLLEYGVTTDRATLTARTAARTAYHQLRDTVTGWTVPAAVREPLSGWEFATAQDAITAALPAWTITGATDETLAGIDARHGPVSAEWDKATTKGDLDAAAALAQRQLDAAKDVASAKAIEEAPRDFVQEVGLIGETVPSLDPAIAAVRTIDTAGASSVTAAIRDVLGRARGAGELRIGVTIAVVAVLLLILALLLFVAFRRRRRTRMALAIAVAVAGVAGAAAGAREGAGAEAPGGDAAIDPAVAADISADISADVARPDDASVAGPDDTAPRDTAPDDEAGLG